MLFDLVFQLFQVLEVVQVLADQVIDQTVMAISVFVHEVLELLQLIQIA